MGTNTSDDGGSGKGGEPGFPPLRSDEPTPGDQERPMVEDEELDEALEETFPASDPIAPSRIDRPGDPERH